VPALGRRTRDAARRVGNRRAGRAATTPSFAQAHATTSGVGVGPSQQTVQPFAQKNAAPTVEHLFGDVGGISTNLENERIYLLPDATTELAGNVSGSVKQGATFANQVGVQADIATTGWDHRTVHACRHRQSIRPTTPNRTSAMQRCSGSKDMSRFDKTALIQALGHNYLDAAVLGDDFGGCTLPMPHEPQRYGCIPDVDPVERQRIHAVR
jgi:carbohydrate-selective porin OprB